MRYKITYYTPEPDEIDLEDYGYGENVKWDDLTKEEQQEIGDNLLEAKHLMVLRVTEI